jgi:hypothetical protein
MKTRAGISGARYFSLKTKIKDKIKTQEAARRDSLFFTNCV